MHVQKPLITADFDFALPPELIAQQPTARRDAARMLVLHRADGRLEHRLISDVPSYLAPHDIVVLNNTKVIPARLRAHKPGTRGAAEVFLLEANPDGTWEALIRCRRRPPPGGTLDLATGARAEIVAYGEEGRATVRLVTPGTVMDFLEQHGETPLPPYIKREREGSGFRVQGQDAANDRERYQTIYARHPGAVAAPTAGLHFTPELFAALEARSVRRTEVTLHVGIGTFRPVATERVEDHHMHEERYEVTPDAADAIRAARAAGGRVVAVGSTSVRTLEAVAAEHGAVVAAAGRTEIFIRPPYAFKAVDVMLTNFHLPKSTLLMMVCALAGHAFVMRAYAEAVRERYRFFSYGDCMLIV